MPKTDKTDNGDFIGPTVGQGSNKKREEKMLLNRDVSFGLSKC